MSAKSADVIDDFHAGDQLILSTRSFGKSLGRLRGHMRVTLGDDARGRGPQLVFSPRWGLLSVDPDGQGGAPPVVIAILKGYHRLPTHAIRIVGP